jgi:hypothetical protein
MHSWTVGSALFLSSWAVMMGPIQYGTSKINRVSLIDYRPSSSPLAPWTL